jgi:hypothetical protein
MNTHPTYRISQVIAASDEYTAPIFRSAEGSATDDLLRDLRWRIADVREMLMSSFGDRRIYGCDEWSTPVVNLNLAIGMLDLAIAATAATGEAS